MDLTLYLVVALTVVLIPYTTCSSYGKLGGDCNGAYVCRRPVRRGIPYKRVCVRRNQLCNGVIQCPRGDDERKCIQPDTECPLLDWPANGYVQHDGFKPEATAIYSCALGFELSGNASRTCLQSGSWEGSVPTCSPIEPDTDCPLLDWPANGYVQHDGFKPEATAIYSCALGFELSGNASRTCLQSGSWEGSVPTCSPIEIDCGSPPEVTGGSFVLTGNSTYGAVAVLTCNTNYNVCGDIEPACRSLRLFVSERRAGYTTCNELGQWTGDYATCVRTDCFEFGRAIEYCGEQTVNSFGDLCVDWTTRTEDYVIDSNFPEGSAAAASNYCRSPHTDYSESKVWCWDVNRRSVDCDIPRCE